MTKKINILGGGQTAMLAAIMLSNRGYQVEILDDKPLKQTHFALLRFKTKQIEEETGIKLEEVEIKKAIYYQGQIYNESNIKFDNLYSQKVTGKIQRRSIGNLGIGKRYIPPIDFFEQLRNKCVSLNVELANCDTQISPDCILQNIVAGKWRNGEKVISTLPMPKLYKTVHNEDLKFEFEKVYVVEFDIPNCNVHQTIYYPDMAVGEPAYRISVIGSNIKCEISEKSYNYFNNKYKNQLLYFLKSQISNSFGIIINDKTIESMIEQVNKGEEHLVIKEQKFGKISPLEEQVRQKIIYNLTKQFNIYSLGRFSCWRQIMMDDVVKDVKRIENLLKLESQTCYESAKSLASRL